MIYELERCLNYISSKMAKKLSDSFERWLTDIGVTRTQWIALYYLYSRGEMSQRELSHLMDIFDSSAMRLVERLIRERLIARRRSESDGRVILVRLTVRGQEMLKKLLPIGIEFSELLRRGISEEDLATFQRVMEQMVENVQSDPRSLK